MEQSTGRRPAPRRPAWRAALWLALGLAVLLAVVVAGALWWASSAGSLATALRWAARYQPVAAEQVTGSLLSGGKIGRLRWQQGALTVEAQDVNVAWQAQAFFNQKIQLDRLSAAQLVINDQRPPDPLKPRGPPESLVLPVAINIDALQITRLQWTGPPLVTVNDVAGRYQFDGQQHRVVLQSAQFEGGRYSGAASLSATNPLLLDAQVQAALQPTLPGQIEPLSLQVHGSATGPLADLAVRANLQRASPRTTGATPATPPPQATASARVMPWEGQPLRELDASFRNLNVAELQAGQPQTLLTGMLAVRPTGNAVQLADQAWSLQAHASNALAGPWDKGRLPVEQFEAAGEWKDGAAMLRTLQARLGAGTLRASGSWQPAKAAPATSQPDTTTASPAWQVDADIANLNPALLYSQLAAVPVSGAAKAGSAGAAINFDVDLKAAARQREPAGAPALLLTLREALLRGNWNPQQAGGTLNLTALRVRTSDAQLSGQVEWQPAASGGAGKLALTAPGLDASVQGELRETRGGGDITLRASDVAQAARWLQQLPGLPTFLEILSASGNASLTAGWQGGWRDPTIQGKLDVPVLDWRRLATPGGTGTATPDAIKVRTLQATLSGKLSQAQLATQGRIEMGGRSLQLQAALTGGRGDGRVAPSSKPSAAQSAPMPAANWQASLTQLELALVDPALSSSAWQLALRRPVDVTWTAARAASGAGILAAGAGEAVLRAPPRRAFAPGVTVKEAIPPTPPQATIAWTPVRIKGGEVATAGKVTGLSMAWLELLAGPQLAAGGVTGDLLLEGEWNVALGDTLRVEASLGRVSGDLTLQAETAERVSARVAAGIREARLSVQSTGSDITVALRWDSNRMGIATGQLATRLQRGADGWTWPANAPLDGKLRAQLPRIGVWSLFAPPGWRLRGAVSTDLALRGTRETPALTGQLEATDLALRSLADGIEFGGGTLRAQLDGTRLRIEEFTLRGAGEKGTGGLLTAQGEAGWIDGRAQVRLDARLERLRASIRNDRQITVSGELQASLQGLQTDVTGKLVIDQARIVLPEENTPQLGSDVVVRTTRGIATGQQAPAQTSEAMAAQALPSDRGERVVKLAVQIDLGPDFRVTGKGINTRLSGALALASTANPSSSTSASPGNLRLNGTINTIGGEYSAYGQRLAIERGLLRFTGAIDNPTLDILAIRPNIAQRVGLEILGTALLPRVRLYAQPELPDADKLSWLITGRASGSGGAEAALLQQAAIALLGSKTGASSAGLASTFGLDELSFRGASSNANGGATDAAVTLGKRFSQNFYAAYERSISGTVGTLFVFYELSRRFTLRGQAGQQSAIDLIYTLQFN